MAKPKQTKRKVKPRAIKPARPSAPKAKQISALTAAPSAATSSTATSQETETDGTFSHLPQHTQPPPIQPLGAAAAVAAVASSATSSAPDGAAFSSRRRRTASMSSTFSHVRGVRPIAPTHAPVSAAEASSCAESNESTVEAPLPPFVIKSHLYGGRLARRKDTVVKGQMYLSRDPTDVERKQMKMKDFIHNTHFGVPMASAAKFKGTKKRTGLSAAAEAAATAKRARLLEFKAIAAPSVSAPQVQLDENGDIVINQESLTIKAAEADTSTEGYLEGDEDQARITSSSYTKRPPSERWGVPETKKFYQALRECGLDLTMISMLFPTRTRRQIRNKYKREERLHPELFEAAIHRRVSLPLPVQAYMDGVQEREEIEIVTEEDVTDAKASGVAAAEAEMKGTDVPKLKSKTTKPKPEKSALETSVAMAIADLAAGPGMHDVVMSVAASSALSVGAARNTRSKVSRTPVVDDDDDDDDEDDDDALLAQPAFLAKGKQNAKKKDAKSKLKKKKKPSLPRAAAARVAAAAAPAPAPAPATGATTPAPAKKSKTTSAASAPTVVPIPSKASSSKLNLAVFDGTAIASKLRGSQTRAKTRAASIVEEEEDEDEEEEEVVGTVIDSGISTDVNEEAVGELMEDEGDDAYAYDDHDHGDHDDYDNYDDDDDA